MGRFRKGSLWVGLILFPTLLFAQFNNNTTSPYSRYGLGDLQPYTMGRTLAMGGASLASRNNQQINLANPASYTAVDSLVFMFEFGLHGRFSRFSTKENSMNANDVNFRYFAMNFQITNWLATSLGLTPYSDVGYNVRIMDEVDNAGDILFNYYGEGSISKAFFGFAVDPVKNISVGVNFNYMFGLLNRSAETYFLESSDFYNNQKYENLRLRDFNIGLGVQGTLPLKNNQHLNAGIILENKPSFTGFYSDMTKKTLTIPTGSTSSRSDQDTIKPFSSEERSRIEFPLTYGVGLSYVKENSLEINVDYYHQSWSKAILPGRSNFMNENDRILTDLDKFALGAEWIPDKFSIRSFLNRIAYRGGIKYEKSYLKIDNQQINDFGITFGVGLPVYRSNSTINIAAEIGRRGTKQHNLVLENYAKINLSVNLYDLWFIQRRYD
ncbi:MAG: hypothetical protein PHV35_09615 [Mariniphaga sp.]|nr:hypothetical protein [Mariniphaga sp.]MDD4227257.1 hypothetical protein [Mariniphaga sp.]